MSSTFFPLPDMPAEQPQPREVHGARVIQVLTPGTDGVLLVVAEIVMEILGFRFMLPIHSKVARSLFRSAGARDVPRQPNSFVIDTEEGAPMFLVSLHGKSIGEDNIPEPGKVPFKAPTDKPLTHVYVLTEVKASALGD